MDTNKLVLEYPRGVSINVTVIGDDGKPINTLGMGPDVLLRLGPNLEFLGMTSGNIKTLIEMSGSSSDDGDDDDDDDDDEEDEGCDSEDGKASMDWDNTINLVSEDDDADEEDDDDDDDDEENDDEIVVSYTVD